MKITKYFVLSSVLLSFIQAEIKIGYVDSNEIMSKFEEVRQVQVDLEKEQRRLESDFNSLVAQLDSLQQDYERQRLLMSETRRQEKENEINKLKDEINRLEIMIEDSKNSYEQMLDKTTQSIQDFIKSAESKKNFQ